MVLKYDFETNRVLDFNLPERNSQVYDQNNIKLKVDRPAFALVSIPEFRVFIAYSLKYPASARENDLQGKVEVGIEIDTSGNILDYKVIKSVHPTLDNEALRVVKLFPNKWIWKPSIKNGKPINSYLVIPISFKLQ